MKPEERGSGRNRAGQLLPHLCLWGLADGHVYSVAGCTSIDLTWGHHLALKECSSYEVLDWGTLYINMWFSQ